MEWLKKTQKTRVFSGKYSLKVYKRLLHHGSRSDRLLSVYMTRTPLFRRVVDLYSLSTTSRSKWSWSHEQNEDQTSLDSCSTLRDASISSTACLRASSTTASSRALSAAISRLAFSSDSATALRSSLIACRFTSLTASATVNTQSTNRSHNRPIKLSSHIISQSARLQPRRGLPPCRGGGAYALRICNLKERS